MRRRPAPPTPALVALLAVGALLVAGCGSSAKGSAGRAPAPVALTVAAPSDLASTTGATLTVTGTVAPADATVRVLGQPAEVVGGRFTARVPLSPGANVIDLAATAQGRGPALTALRVTREMPIVLPDLTHLTTDAARARVERLGLRLRTQDTGGLFEKILPGTVGVCDQRPDPGTQVRRGTVVLALVAKRC
jgi:hypothetical protein